MRNESGLQPVEFNVIVRMKPTEETTAGGIILPTSKTERDELAEDEGTLVAVSPHAFSYAEWPDGVAPPQVGDQVIIAQYQGRIWKPGGDKGPTYRIIKDKDVVAVIEPPAKLAAAA